MPKIVRPLSVSQVKNAKPKDKLYKLSDGGGLALWVLPSGGKSWRLTYTRPDDNKQDTMTLGLYPDFSLADARDWRDQIKAKLARGINPKAEQPVELDTAYQFRNRLYDWHKRWATEGGKDGTGKNPKYAAQVMAALEANILPHFIDRDVRTITTAEVVAVLRQMEDKGVLEYLRRTKSSLGLFFDYLVADGTIPINPTKVIGRQVFKRAQERHFSALPYTDLPLLIERLETSPEIGLRAKLLIYWQLLSMTRPSEAAGTAIAEIDLDRGLWEIPLQRMKTRAHIVPLSSALLRIYHEARPLSVNGVYLFEGRGYLKPIGVDTARIKLHAANINSSGHGLRSLARTYLREVHHIPHDVGEMLLSHTIGDRTNRAYNRAELLEERRHYLELWGQDVMALRDKFSQIKQA